MIANNKYVWENLAAEWVNFLAIFLRFSGVIIHKEKPEHFIRFLDMGSNSLYPHQMYGRALRGGLKKGEINIIAAGVGVGKSIISKG